MYVLLCSFLPQCTCTLSTSLSCSFPRNNFYWIIFHYFSFELRGRAVAESANIAWPTRTETLDLGDRRLESRRAWPSSSGPSKTIKSKTSEQCKWQVMISLLCAVKRGARRSTRSRTKTKNPKTKKCGGTGWDWGWGLLFFLVRNWYWDWAKRWGGCYRCQQRRQRQCKRWPEDQKTWPKTMHTAQRDPIYRPRSKVSSLWRTNKILYSYFMPKMLESPRVDQINAIVCPFLVKLCALHKQIQQIQTTTHTAKEKGQKSKQWK